jgi:cell division protein FtsB
MSDMKQFVATPTVEELEAEIERLTKGWEGLEYETSAQIASLAAAINTMHKEAIEQEKHIAKLQAVVDAARDFINNPHSTRTAIRIFDALAELDADDDA